MLKEAFDELYECCGYCVLAVNGYEAQLNPMIHCSEMEKALKKRNQSIEVIQNMIPKKMEYFFKQMGEAKVTLAQMLTLSFYNYQATSLKQAKQIISDTFHSYSLTDFPPFSLNLGGITLGNRDESCPFTESLSALELSDEEKFQILSAFMNYDQSINQLFDLFEKIKPQLPQYDLSAFIAYWKEEKNQQSLKVFLKRLGVAFEHQNSQLIISPTAYLPATFKFMANEGSQEIYLIISHTCTLELLTQLMNQKNEIKKEAILKILSDPSKYEILKLIKDKAYYGAEIAKAMKLKTSTISYHLNACVNAQLVNVEKIENKIYFELNHQTMNAFIEALKDDFKEKE